MIFKTVRLRKMLVAGVSSLILCSALSALPAYAENKNIGSWNMQGSNASTESKWRATVSQLLDEQNLFILSLQEAGYPPLSAQPFSPANFANTGWPYGIGNGPQVNGYTWNRGTSSRPNVNYIYWIDTDPNGHRVNNAIVTRNPADQVISFHPPGAQRAVFGVRFGNTWYFSVHARSGVSPNSGRNDVPAILQAINAIVAQLPGSSTGYTWVALGDWNREPPTLRTTTSPIPGAPHVRYFFPKNNPATFPTTNPQRTYDYYIINRRNLISILAAVLTTIHSDHLPTFYKYREP
jgi:cytolethal distending toxin subunit B